MGQVSEDLIVGRERAALSSTATAIREGPRARPLPGPAGLRPPHARPASAGGKRRKSRKSSPACRPRPRCSAEGRPRCWRRSPRRSRHRHCCPPSRQPPRSRRPRRPRRPGPCSGGRGSRPAGPSSTWRTMWSCRRCRWASGPVASWRARAAPAGAATREWRPPARAARWSARHSQRQEERRGRRAVHAGTRGRPLPPGGRKAVPPALQPAPASGGPQRREAGSGAGPVLEGFRRWVGPAPRWLHPPPRPEVPHPGLLEVDCSSDLDRLLGKDVGKLFGFRPGIGR